MTIWAIADLHLSKGIPGKTMDKFGEHWHEHDAKIAANWRDCVTNDDLVLVAGDISWAMRLEQALRDLEWLDALPGEKLLVRGNHDYWWPRSQRKLKDALPASVHAICKDVFRWRDVVIGGTRLWNIPGICFEQFKEYPPNFDPELKEAPQAIPGADDHKILSREVGRLRQSLEKMESDVNNRICMTHFPPLGADLRDTEVATMIESFRCQKIVFGHLHNISKVKAVFGLRNGTDCILTACDYLDFAPVKIMDA